MDKVEIISWARVLQGISKAQLSKMSKLKTGTISKLDTRGQVLSEQNMDTVLNVLQVEAAGEDFRFKKGAFVKVLVKDGGVNVVGKILGRVGDALDKILGKLIGLPDYHLLYQLLDKYKDLQIKVFFVFADDKSLLDQLFQKEILPEVPANFMVLSIGNKDLLVFVRRKNAYLTYIDKLEKKLRQYTDKIDFVVDRDIKFKNASKSMIESFLLKHDKKNAHNE